MDRYLIDKIIDSIDHHYDKFEVIYLMSMTNKYIQNWMLGLYSRLIRDVEDQSIRDVEDQNILPIKKCICFVDPKVCLFRGEHKCLHQIDQGNLIWCRSEYHLFHKKKPNLWRLGTRMRTRKNNDDKVRSDQIDNWRVCYCPNTCYAYHHRCQCYINNNRCLSDRHKCCCRVTNDNRCLSNNHECRCLNSDFDCLATKNHNCLCKYDNPDCLSDDHQCTCHIRDHCLSTLHHQCICHMINNVNKNGLFKDKCLSQNHDCICSYPIINYHHCQSFESHQCICHLVGNTKRIQFKKDICFGLVHKPIHNRYGQSQCKCHSCSIYSSDEK